MKIEALVGNDLEAQSTEGASLYIVAAQIQTTPGPQRRAMERASLTFGIVVVDNTF